MKQYLLIILLIAIGSIQFVKADEPNNDKVDKISSKQFTIDYFNSTNHQFSSQQNNMIYAFYYKGKNEEYVKISTKEIKDAKQEDEEGVSKTFNYPLQFDELVSYLSPGNQSLIAKDIDGKENYVSQFSVLQVYIWLDALKYFDEKPQLAGVLHVHSIVRTYSNTDNKEPDLKNNLDLEELNNFLIIKNSLIGDLTSKLKKLNEAIDNKNDSIKSQDSSKFIAISDSLKNKEIYGSNVINNLTDSLKSIKKLLAKKRNEIYDANYALVKEISFQFERGFLERIQVIVTDQNNRDEIYENYYALGFTSIFNYKKLCNVKLYARNPQCEKHIFFQDVVTNYNNEIANYTRDYSPADTSVMHVDPSNTPLVSLFKSKTGDLLESKVYSDLFGLADKNPNGIIQTELSRRFNLFTYRYAVPHGWRTNVGWFSNIDLSGTLSKIEKKQRYLTLHNQRTFINNQLASPSFATNLDYMRYESFSIMANMNLVLFDVPEGKFTFYIDGGIKYANIPLLDSIRTNFNGAYNAIINEYVPAAGIVTVYPRLKVEVFAERRYGFQFSWQLNNSHVFSNNQYKAVMSYEKSDLYNLPIERYSHTSNQFELFARFEPNPNNVSGKLFFRARFLFQRGDVNTSYSQFQIGYAYNFVYSR